MSGALLQADGCGGRTTNPLRDDFGGRSGLRSAMRIFGDFVRNLIGDIDVAHIVNTRAVGITKLRQGTH